MVENRDSDMSQNSTNDYESDVNVSQLQYRKCAIFINFYYLQEEVVQSGRNNSRGVNLQNNHSPGNHVNHHAHNSNAHHNQYAHQHPKSHHYPQPVPQSVHNQPLYGNLLNNYNNSNNGKSNSVASYNSRQSGGQVSISSQSSSTSSIPTANANELDAAYRNPLSLRRESSSSFGQSNRVSPSVSLSERLFFWLH